MACIGLRGLAWSPSSCGITAVLALTAAASTAAEWKTSEWKPYPAGQVPAPLQLTDLAGKSVDLAAFKGEVVLVNFWATWCEPCRDEMPALNRLQQNLHGKPFKVLAVNVGEGVARIQQFLTQAPVRFRLVRDVDLEVMRAWRVRVLPASFLVDNNGLLRYQLVGAANWDEATIQSPILELLR